MAVFTKVFGVLSLLLVWTGSCESKDPEVSESQNGKNAKFTIKLDDVMADLDTFETQASELVRKYGRLQGHCTLVAHDELPGPRSCADTSDAGVTTIYPDGVTPTQVYCDQDTDGGRWTVFQRRLNGSLVSFDRTWAEYQQGFGDPSSAFWLGLDALHMLTSRQRCELRVDLMSFHGRTGSATYSNFSISDSSDNYRLSLGAFTGGSAGDSLSFNKDLPFSTWDADHDISTDNCASDLSSGWWFEKCYSGALLNAPFIDSWIHSSHSIHWYTFEKDYALYFTEMKLRPV